VRRYACPPANTNGKPSIILRHAASYTLGRAPPGRPLALPMAKLSQRRFVIARIICADSPASEILSKPVVGNMAPASAHPWPRIGFS
jgi:hypothetical protein